MQAKILDNKLYIENLKNIASVHNFEHLSKKTMMISGATGMIGTCLIDLIMYVNRTQNKNIKIIALGRSREKAASRFPDYIGLPQFEFIECDITKPLPHITIPIDYIIHAASTTHPIAYATEPIGTITSNVFGTINLLEYGIQHGLKRFIFVSSVEIYGENRGDIEEFSEDYCGYINSNTLRAGYPESKRLCEALCQAYRKQKGIEIIIPRLTRSFGPTMLMSDSKAISQFIKNGLYNEDIILKSEGNQLYTYTYALDAASGILACILQGKDGEAYNIADNANNITLKDLAKLIADYCGTQVKFDIPNDIEKAGYSTATKALMKTEKANSELHWHVTFKIKDGIQNTIDILKDIYG